MNSFEMIPMRCAIRALARRAYRDGHSAPQVTEPSDAYLDQCIMALNAGYEAAAEVHATVGDVNVDRVQLAADQGMEDAVHELSEFD